MLGFGVEAIFDIFLFAVIMLSVAYFRIEAMKENRKIYNILKKLRINHKHDYSHYFYHLVVEHF